MTTLIKLIYAAVVASLLVLAVAFGVRTFYSAPEAPEFPQPPIGFRPLAPVVPGGQQPEPTEEQRQYEEAQRRYQEEYRRYEERLETYRRNVFFVATLAGVVSAGAGTVLVARLDALRLGLVAGGLGCILYAVVQAHDDLDDFGPEIAFALTLAGLAAVLAAGYRWLSRVTA